MFAVLFIPDFPAEAVARALPELRQQALVIVEGTPPLLHVIACNDAARQAGVELGMTKLEAEARLSANSSRSSRRDAAHVAPGSCPAGPVDGSATSGWAIRRRSTAQEAAAHAALVDCACAFSPRVEYDPAMPDTVVLDLSGLDRLFGPPAKIARDLARRASEMGLEANVGVAANIEAATCAARGFTGVTVIPPGNERERLGPLPVDLLLSPADARAPEILETLDRWGVRTFRTLAALPETAVAQRLGPGGVRLQKLARGEGSRPLVPSPSPLAFAEAVELEYPVTLLEPLAFVLHGMLENLCARLAARALSTNELRLRLQMAAPAADDSINAVPESKPNHGLKRIYTDQNKSEIENQKSKIEDQHDYELIVRLPVPMLEARTFLKLLQLELRGRPPQAPVERVFLSAEPVPPRFTQGGLFLPTAPEPEKLELTLARIKRVVSGEERFGISDLAFGIAEDAGLEMRKTSIGAPDKSQVPNPKSQMLSVGAAELLDTHRPDAFRLKKFAPPPADDRHNAASSPHDQLDIAQRETRNAKRGTEVSHALRRFRPPLAARVHLRDGTPVRIAISDYRFVAPGSCPAGPIHASKAADGQRRNFVLQAAPAGQEPSAAKPSVANVIWAAGPWHESGDWWTEHPWQREAWDVGVQQDGTTAVYRIFRDAIADQWWVEAEYD